MESNSNYKVVIPKSTLKWAGIGITALIFIIGVGYLVFPVVFGPKPEIVTRDAHEGFEGLNYVYFIDVTVKNNGESGYVKIFAEINGAGRYEKQDRRIYLGCDESKQETFAFDISLLGSLTQPSISYKVWTVAD